MTAPEQRRSAARSTVLSLCLAAIVFEGYDIVAYGTALPTMLTDPFWQLTPARAGLVGSYALIGMLVGSVLVGLVADFVGRRLTFLVSTAWFSAWMAICAVAPSIEFFGFARFMVGLGVGALIPTAAALAVEFAPPGKGNTQSAIAWAGYPGGGVLAALVGLAVLEPFGPRTMFWVGALPLITILPLAYKLLPESPAFLAVKNRHEEAAAIALRFGLSTAVQNDEAAKSERRGPVALFARHRVIGTLLLGVMSACGLLLTYGLNTWLPQLMRAEGFALGSALTFLLVLNAGAIIVPLFASRVADRIGPRMVVGATFLAAAVAILVLSGGGVTAALMALTFVAGAGTIGAQVLVYGFAANYYPDGCRAAGLAWTASVGRIGGIVGPTLTGLLIGAGFAASSNFIFFAFVAVIGAVAAVVVPRAAGRNAPTASITTSGTQAKTERP